ncbi:MAG: hypothetical protein IKR81_15060 [Victivallales bacterium]|nr:hypothetical protein [Victivallales bacterium]
MKIRVIMALGALLLLASCGQKEVKRYLESTPSGAGVWSELDELVGNTPMPVPANGSYTIRHPGCQDATLEISETKPLAFV